MAPLVRTGGSRHTGLAAPPHRNIHFVHKNCINIIENRFKEPSIRLFFTERTTFSSFDI